MAKFSGFGRHELWRVPAVILCEALPFSAIPKVVKACCPTPLARCPEGVDVVFLKGLPALE